MSNTATSNHGTLDPTALSDVLFMICELSAYLTDTSFKEHFESYVDEELDPSPLDRALVLDAFCENNEEGEGFSAIDTLYGIVNELLRSCTALKKHA